MNGGAMWRITRHDEEDITYVVGYNHEKERHLNGCSFDGKFTGFLKFFLRAALVFWIYPAKLRPYLLVTDSLNAMYIQFRRKERDELG